MDLMTCSNCGGRNRDKTIVCYCSLACKNAYEQKRLEKRLEEMKTHNPWDRWSDEERKLYRGQVVWNEKTLDPSLNGPSVTIPISGYKTTSSTPVVAASGEQDKRHASMRVCGNCKMVGTGHNSRTCPHPKKR